MTRNLLALALAATAIGCMPKRAYVPVENPYRDEDDTFELRLPEGWMRLNADGDILVTRDGFSLQVIRMTRLEVGQPLASSKRKLVRGMEPAEVAEVLSGEFASKQNITGVKLLESSPARIAGAPGMKIVFSFKDSDGLRKKSVFYGVLGERWIWYLAYAAPARYYFDADLPTFEKVVASVRLVKSRSY
jgi:hypothetical protein